jgi:hypothetical protein
MNKVEALGDFFKALKTVFNISSLYSQDHPFFTKTVVEFKNKIDTTFTHVSEIKFGVANNYLLVEDTMFSQATVYLDLAKMFHVRKIKSIEIKKPVSVKELIIFLNRTSAPPREIFKQGGITAILNKEGIQNITIEELDYSQLLAKGQGTDYKDIWEYLLKEATEKFDLQQINVLTDNFGKIVGQFSAKELLQNGETKSNIHKLFNYLKEKDKEKFSQCSTAIAKSILNDKMASQEDPEKIKEFFKDLTDENLSVILGDEILNNDNFDALSFDFFSKLVENDRHRNIASLTGQNLLNSQQGPTLKTKKKIDKLVSFSRSASISQVYRKALASLLKDTPFKAGAALNQDSLKDNYRYIILNLFEQEDEEEKIKLLLTHLSRILAETMQEEDFEFIKAMLQLIQEVRAKHAGFAAYFTDLDKKISALMENIILNKEGAGVFLDIESFFSYIKESSFGLDFYIHKIFNEHLVNPAILKLFFKLFADKMEIFYENLIKMYSDTDFFMLFMENIKKVNPETCLEILKRTYMTSSTIVKIEILRTMLELPIQDNGFLLDILKNGDRNLKKQALMLLLRDIGAPAEAMESLLLISTIWGKNNTLVMDNIQLIEDMHIFEATDYLAALSKKPFFWNRNLRKKAKEALLKLK